ncbi:MAG: polysaccharide export protein [Sphingomonadales bacterium]|nr:polysaccharide export protein [Sphingomonadales bacterium]
MKMPLVLLILIASLSACAGNKTLGLSPDVNVIETGALPEPTRSDLLSETRTYLIGPFDKLKIDVFGVEELSREVQIDGSGDLSFPLVGVVQASGLTPGELAIKIEDGLRGRYVRNPDVTVNLEETVSQVVTVDGQVDKPGSYPVIGKMTLMRAIANAGGASEFAKLDDVIIFRNVNGQQLVGIYNLKAIRRGNYGDPNVFANDVIIVGDSSTRRLFKDIIQAAPLITTPIVLLLR